MAGKLQLAIPNPCHENWDEMNGTDRNRFCQKFQSTVVEFSTLTRVEAKRLMTSSLGRVASGAAVPRAKVEVRSTNLKDPLRMNGETDVSGAFSVSIPEGRYSLAVETEV